MKKTLLFFLIALMFCAVCIGGCGGSSDSPDSDPTEETSGDSGGRQGNTGETINLSTLLEDYIASDDQTLTGRLAANAKTPSATEQLLPSATQPSTA